jgi:hypothetical protein
MTIIAILQIIAGILRAALKVSTFLPLNALLRWRYRHNGLNPQRRQENDKERPVRCVFGPECLYRNPTDGITPEFAENNLMLPAQSFGDRVES